VFVLRISIESVRVLLFQMMLIYSIFRVLSQSRASAAFGSPKTSRIDYQKQRLSVSVKASLTVFGTFEVELIPFIVVRVIYRGQLIDS
jgi:hypothetical protein